MQHQIIEQSQRQKTQGKSRSASDDPKSTQLLPSSGEVLFEFGVMLAVSLGLAVGAHLLLVVLNLQ